jgi:transcriptional regulator
MYQPAHGKFKVEDPRELLSAVSAQFPATLVSLGGDGYWTSMLPMLFYPDEPGAGVLHGHLARGNPHWRELERDGRAVAIFNGAEAYVSPAWYEEKRLTGKVVPTWNYSTVVVHGSITTHPEPDWLLAHVRRLVDRHEAGQAAPWSLDDVPDGYAETQVRAIVGLEFRITSIEAKRKLNQNRSAADVDGVIAALRGGTDRQAAVAADMEAATMEAAADGPTRRRPDATRN